MFSFFLFFNIFIIRSFSFRISRCIITFFYIYIYFHSQKHIFKISSFVILIILSVIVSFAFKIADLLFLLCYSIDVFHSKWTMHYKPIIEIRVFSQVGIVRCTPFSFKLLTGLAHEITKEINSSDFQVNIACLMIGFRNNVVPLFIRSPVNRRFS